MVASVLREKVRESSLSHVRLSTSIARSLHVDVSPNTSDSKPIKLTTQDLSKIQVDMNFSTNTTLRLAGLIRNSTENRKSVEANTKTKLCKINHSLDSFFAVTTMNFYMTSAKNEQCHHVDRPVIYCSDLDGLVYEIMEKRDYMYRIFSNKRRGAYFFTLKQLRRLLEGGA